jgi:hypothetical protein
MAKLPANVHGDPAVWTRSLGRPNRVWVLTDSIGVHWVPKIPRWLHKVRGTDAGRTLISVPPSTLPAVHKSHANFDQRYTNGAGTLSAPVIAGATSLPINARTVPGTKGWWGDGMLVTVTDGTNTETIAVAAGQYQIGLGAPFSSSPMSIPLAAGLAHPYASGSTVTFARPSGYGQYWFGNNTEFVFNAGASPFPAHWADNRFAQSGTGDAGGTTNENTLYADGSFADVSIKVTHFYLATPKASGENTMRLWGVPCDSTGWPFPAGSTTHVDFDLFAATPTIRAVSLTVPAPVAYAALRGGQTSTVTCSGTGSFRNNDLYIPLGFYFERAAATDGYGFIFSGLGGMWQGDYAADAGAGVDVGMSPAYVSQFVQAAGIDTLMVQLGLNGYGNTGAEPATSVANFRAMIANARAGNLNLGAILLGYTSLQSDGNAVGVSNAIVDVADADANVLALQLQGEGPQYGVMDPFTSDHVHPSDPTGSDVTATQFTRMLARVEGYAAGLASLVQPAPVNVVSQPLLTAGQVQLLRARAARSTRRK